MKVWFFSLCGFLKKNLSVLTIFYFSLKLYLLLRQFWKKTRLWVCYQTQGSGGRISLSLSVTPGRSRTYPTAPQGSAPAWILPQCSTSRADKDRPSLRGSWARRSSRTSGGRSTAGRGNACRTWTSPWILWGRSWCRMPPLHPLPPPLTPTRPGPLQAAGSPRSPPWFWPGTTSSSWGLLCRRCGGCWGRWVWGWGWTQDRSPGCCSLEAGPSSLAPVSSSSPRSPSSRQQPRPLPPRWHLLLNVPWCPQATWRPRWPLCTGALRGPPEGPCAPVESADYPDLTTPIRSQDFQSDTSGLKLLNGLDDCYQCATLFYMNCYF